jgi:anaerobic selenocysteine-containing dehydrogenase
MKNRVFRSICGFCHSNCGLKVHVRNGKISSVEGDPDHPVNKGHLCIKARAIKQLVESEDRLKYPLKKTKGGLVRISWGEALDFAADRLTKIREKYGPESLVRFAGAPISYEGRDGFLQFMGAYGSPNLTGAGNLCFVPRQVAFIHTFGGRPEPDYENAQLIIFWGVNPANTTRFSSYASYDGFHNIIPRARERGAKIISVDPIRSETVSLTDDWIRPNIGTDSALGLSMIHTIINEDLYDEEFVGQWVVGFDEIKKHVETLSPEWAEKITSIPAARIKEFARLYAKTQGALIHDGNGLDMHTNGVDMVRVICILIALTGNVDKPGGNVFFSVVPQKLLPTIATGKRWMGWEEFPLFPQTSFPVIKKALLNEGPDRPRAMIVHHSNPVLVQANQERTKKALQNLDFLMVFDIFPTATTEIADLILPSASDFERVDYRAYSSSRGGFLALREKVVEPVGESRSVFEVEYELAKRMGIEESYPFRNTEEWINFVLEPSHVTIDDLRNNSIVYASPPVVYRKYKKDGFQTPSRMVECYSERFKSFNYAPLPLFQYPKESHRTNPEWSNEYRLLGTTRKPAEFVHTKLRNVPILSKGYPNPLIMVHPTDAGDRGIRQNDLVEVKSPRGRIRVEAKITEDIGPGLVAVDFGWGNPTDKKASINALTSDDVWDPISGGYPNRLFLCEIKNLFEEGP